MKRYQNGWAWYLPRCQRCQERSWYLKASMLNKQRCCETCIQTEKELEHYDRVRDTVMEELLKGTNKFPELNIFR